MIYILNPNTIDFPDPREGEEDGIFAVGGDLSIDRLLLAYSNGIFPWYAFRAEDNSFQDKDGKPWIQWWCPMQRFVIFPNEIHISHSMRTLLRKQQYVFSINKAFPQVIHNCGRLRIDECGAWLGPHIEKAYTELYEQGFAASIEVWESSASAEGSLTEVGTSALAGAEKRKEVKLGSAEGSLTEVGTSALAGAEKRKEVVYNNEKTSERSEDDYYDANGNRLVGGLYGVTLGNCFFGESMFSLVPSGSKMALIFLARFMQDHGMTMIDCQLETPHLKSMGGRFIPYDEYMKYVREIGRLGD